MPRHYKPLLARYKQPDPVYNSAVIAKLINSLMSDGKKTRAQQIFYNAMDIISEQIKDIKPEDVLNKALDNSRPTLKTKSRRVGGATYQVPVEVPFNKSLSYAIKWIIEIARKKKGRPMAIKLADELLAAYKGEGDAVKKKEDTHKMAESNRAFAHLSY
ncbi:MAG: 30S ribosomal protein S7 [Planctomycetes bacterium]|nr:30S ribosomal protein S7 [Planctomycetota bacterium]